MSPSPAADSGLVDLFAQLRVGVLITLKRDGRPQSSVVGHTFDPATITARISVTRRARRPETCAATRANYHVTRPDLWAYAVGEAVAEFSPVATDPPRPDRGSTDRLLPRHGR